MTARIMMLSPIAYGQFSADRENIATSGAEDMVAGMR